VVQKPVVLEYPSGQSVSEEVTSVFGGDVVGAPIPPNPMGTIQQHIAAYIPSPPVVHTNRSHLPPEVEAQIYARKEQQARSRERVRLGPTIGRTVPKDDLGYPVVYMRGVDPIDLIAYASLSLLIDDDGVGSI